MTVHRPRVLYGSNKINIEERALAFSPNERQWRQVYGWRHLREQRYISLFIRCVVPSRGGACSNCFRRHADRLHSPVNIVFRTAGTHCWDTTTSFSERISCTDHRHCIVINNSVPFTELVFSDNSSFMSARGQNAAIIVLPIFQMLIITAQFVQKQDLTLVCACCHIKYCAYLPTVTLTVIIYTS